MAGIDVQGVVVILGAVDFQTSAGDPADSTSGDVTFNGVAAIASVPGEIGTVLGGLAPVPYPPPPATQPFQDCTTGFATASIIYTGGPNAIATANSVPFVTLGSLFLEKGPAAPCQPIVGIGKSTAIATTPIMLITDSLTSPGFMNGVGFNSP